MSARAREIGRSPTAPLPANVSSGQPVLAADGQDGRTDGAALPEAKSTRVSSGTRMNADALLRFLNNKRHAVKGITAFNVRGNGRIVITFDSPLPVDDPRRQLVARVVQRAIQTRKLTAGALGVSPRLHRLALAELEQRGLIAWPRQRGVTAHWR